MIAFNFQDSHYPFSFENCVKNIRIYYPTELIDFYIDFNSDKILQYKKICSTFGVEMTIRETEQGYIKRQDPIDVNLPKILESHYRIYNTCKKTDSEWIMLLEDDVLIKRKIINWPKSDCGKNRHDVGFLGGGSIFNRIKYIEAYEKVGIEGISEIIKRGHPYSWAGDEVKREMFKQINYSEEKWIELAEPDYFDNTDHAVYHGFKEYHKLG